MDSFVLIDGDLAMFQPAFGVAVVAVRPARLRATGADTHEGRKLCVVGDERTLDPVPCPYFTPVHPIPGMGTLEIGGLGGNHVATETRSGGRPVLLAGAGAGDPFIAVFRVLSPAMMPAPSGPPIPDPMPQYTGSGFFLSSNATLKGK